MFQQILVQPPWMKNQHRTLFAAQPGLVLKNKLAHIVEAALVESIESRALDAVFIRPMETDFLCSQELKDWLAANYVERTTFARRAAEVKKEQEERHA